MLRPNPSLPAGAPTLSGSSLEASLRLSIPPGRTNPGQFATRAYLERQGIGLTATARSARAGSPHGARGMAPLGTVSKAPRTKTPSGRGPERRGASRRPPQESGAFRIRAKWTRSPHGAVPPGGLSGFNVGLLLVAFSFMAHLFGHPSPNEGWGVLAPAIGLWGPRGGPTLLEPGPLDGGRLPLGPAPG